QAQLVDTESEPQKAPSEIEELQSLGSRAPLMGKEFETVEPSGTKTDSSHSSASSDSTTPLAYDRACPARHALVHLARVTKAMALSDSTFRKRYRSFYETPLPSPSLTLPVRKRYRGISELILDTDSEGDKLGNEEDESSDVDDEREREREEEVIPEGQQQVVLVVETAVTKPLGLDYGALRRCELAVKEDHVPSTFEVGQSSRSLLKRQGAERTLPSLEWSLGSLPFSPSSLIVPSPVASPVATPTATISRYMFRSLEREQERTAMAFGALWRSVLALEAWAGHVDTRLVDMSRTRYDDHRLINDMLIQHAAMQRELQAMRGRVIALEQERDRREQ
nr:hypothetical protein [Tanacetum cinerariifolium]